MALPKVTVNLLGGMLGSVLAISDGTAGFVLTGTDEGDVTVGEPFSIASLDDLVAKGMTVDNNPFAYKVIKEFYDEAPLGSLLYVLIVANTMHVDDMADKTNGAGAKALLDYAAGKIRILGLMYDAADDNAITTTNGIDAKCYDAASNLQSMANDYQTKKWPFRGVIGATGIGMVAGVVGELDFNDLIAQTGNTFPNAGIFIGQSDDSGDACLGKLLGRMAKIPVQRKVSRVKDGQIASMTSAYIGSKLVEQYTGVEGVHDAGFITLRTFPNKNGYYFSGDPSATATTDDFHFIARGRVMDKAIIITNAVLTEELDDEVPVDDAGLIDSNYAKWVEQQVINQLTLAMKNKGNCSRVDCFVDPNQDIIATSTLNVVTKIQPKGYATFIEENLSFEKSAS